MSKLRASETQTSKGGKALPNDTALFLIRDAVAKRRGLIYGKLNGPNVGEHCAMGCFWDDNPDAIVESTLVDEVAAVNDSLPKSATPHERWKKVSSWLRFKLKSLTRGQ